MDSANGTAGTHFLMPHGKLISREDAACWQSAESCLEQARQMAASLLEETRQSIEDERCRGYEQGRQQAREEQAALMAEALVRRDAYLAAVEGELVGVVINAVRKVFDEFDDAERIRIVVAKALRSVRAQPQAVVRVHPSECNTLREAVDVLTRASQGLRELRFEPDSTVRPGACVLVTDIGVVETDLDTQLRAIEQSLRLVTMGRTLTPNGATAGAEARASGPTAADHPARRSTDVLPVADPPARDADNKIDWMSCEVRA